MGTRERNWDSNVLLRLSNLQIQKEANLVSCMQLKLSRPEGETPPLVSDSTNT